MTNTQTRGESASEAQSGARRRKAALAHAFSLAADEYDEANGPFFNPIGVRLARLAGLRPGDRVLDVGCGRGAVLFAALAEVGPEGYVVGVDLAAGMVRATAAHAAGLGLRNVHVRLDDAESLGFPDCSFEAALSSFALIFTPDPEAALTSLRRVLVPGGRLGFTAFGADEPGWERPLAALNAFLPPAAAHRRQSRAAKFNPLGRSPEEAAELLHRAAFTDLRTVEHQAATHYPDATAWWQSLRAGGWRGLLESIPAERLDEARAAAFAELAALAHPDGSLVRRTSVRYTTAISG
ncbi:ubiquinone/menaquinone biosynthesis C-methylase UbiE [Kitasatospora sp. MAP12-15]|uniref:class I SAM-dependent methyltransferase n=1 Tax=unclassified Kitasatospora TaxID=2633591 RepID=UPI00247432D4|nr:methyltransferase domain-containing protein [Kitasatospora sp. MAP12-44]MDH6112281.1 ubiquinone/menaquinone biosynthesis C-methylase UbiE [Kitasatospora sp. MAP12-44]